MILIVAYNHFLNVECNFEDLFKLAVMSLLFFVFLCFYSEETAKNPVNRAECLYWLLQVGVVPDAAASTPHIYTRRRKQTTQGKGQQK